MVPIHLQKLVKYKSLLLATGVVQEHKLIDNLRTTEISFLHIMETTARLNNSFQTYGILYFIDQSCFEVA